ncbi:MAG: DUF4105 domain-containing protein [Gammaproteobacteria bacterium]|nr:DUF4105 domain-containing protein [Gammaproteobacteria bacterium]
MPQSSAMCRTSLFLAASLAAWAVRAAPAGAHPVAPVSAEAADQEPVPEDQGLPEPAPGSDLRVSLITVGAGPVVYEMFGHNAIRIQDPARGLDVSYNWGMFNTGEEGFFWRFLLGDWQYWMAGLSSEGMIAHYVASDRGVVEQELDLTPDQRLTLLGMAEFNARPENAWYRYQYFLDNCSTRVRDALDVVLDGRLREGFGEVPGETFRFHTRRLTADNALVYVSLDFFMGGRGDRPVTAWDEMFIPMMMRDFLRDTDLVTSEAVLDDPARVPPAEPPRHFRSFYLTGILLAWLAGGAFVSFPRLRTAGPTLMTLLKVEFVLVAGIWSLVAGLSGLVMIVSHFTAHEFMHWNENFLQANPVSLVLAVALGPAVFADRWRRLATRTAQVAAGVSVLGLVMQVVPGIDQVNGYHLAVAVPVHLAIAWGVPAMVRVDTERSAAS